MVVNGVHVWHRVNIHSLPQCEENSMPPRQTQLAVITDSANEGSGTYCLPSDCNWLFRAPAWAVLKHQGRWNCQLVASWNTAIWVNCKWEKHNIFSLSYNCCSMTEAETSFHFDKHMICFPSLWQIAHCTHLIFRKTNWNRIYLSQRVSFSSPVYWGATSNTNMKCL